MSEDEDADKMNNFKKSVDQHKLDQSAARYENLMKKSFLDPKAAQGRMDDYRAKHGNEALYQKLADTPRKPTFGRRPGSILSTDGYREGAGDRRRDSHIARQSLPDAVRNYHADKEEAEASRKAVEKGGGPGGRGGSGGSSSGSPSGGPSFSEQQQQKREAQDRSDGTQAGRDARDLERMRQSREADKDRER